MDHIRLVTSALPYANNDLHIGHILEHAQADIWVRFQRMRNANIVFLCGDDTHGTPIMLRAELLGITPEELIATQHNKNKEVFKTYHISFDKYSSTHSSTQDKLVQELYLRLKKNGHLVTRSVEQFYDVEKQMFLPDRYIKGQCPSCGALDQYGDNCEVCSKIYSPIDLVNPYSVLTGTKPEIRASKHQFLDLPKFEQTLKRWMNAGTLQVEIYNKLKEWFEQGLNEWCITRDKPYFGIKVPDEKDKYFYVWLDAPVGYLSFFKEYCDQNGLNFDEYTKDDLLNDKFSMTHFIGKDIVYFHSLFWPALLEGVELMKPKSIFAHGYVTVDGLKMSKSRGTFIKAKTFAEHFPAEALRYYFAAKLNASVNDIDLNLKDFVARVNSDIVNKYINLASRSAGFIKDYFNNTLSKELDDDFAYHQFTSKFSLISESFATLNFSRAIREISYLADDANRYFNDLAPWIIAKDENKRAQLQKICTQTLLYFRAIMIMLKPVLPETVSKVQHFFNEDDYTWNSLNEIPLGKKINTFSPMFTRLDVNTIDQLIAKSKEDVALEQKITDEAKNKNNSKKIQASSPEVKSVETVQQNYITIDDFAKVDLRVATVLGCGFIEGSDKLLTFDLDLGNGERRTIFSGIKEWYPEPNELIGQQVVVVYNLAPRKMRFGISEGMILSAKDSAGLKLLTVAGQVESGSKVA